VEMRMRPLRLRRAWRCGMCSRRCVCACVFVCVCVSICVCRCVCV
jgi:hypothetical protein